MLKALFYFLYELIHRSAVYIFKKVKIFNFLIPTLHIKLEYDLYSWMKKKNYKVSTIYEPLKTYHTESCNKLDNPFFDELDHITTERKRNYKDLIYERVYFGKIGKSVVHQQSGFTISWITKDLFVETNVFKDKFLANQQFYDSIRRFQLKIIKNKSTFLVTSNNYYHSITEFIIRIFLYNQYIKEEITIYTNKLNSFHKELLKFFELESLNIKELESNENYLLFEDFYFLSFAGLSGFPNPIIVQMLNKRIHEKLHGDKKNELLFISRTKSKQRRLINQKEVESKILNKYAIKILDLEELSVQEQFEYFYGAKIIIGIHGAGLSNVLACSKAKIIELFNEKYVVDCYFHLCACLDIEYHYILCQNYGTPMVINNIDYYGSNDIIINIDELELIIQKLIKTI